jgi:L-cysteine:1D-myo-inositol 2-amino-2-deoxy-alpha-D-glucopyranoside ligase
MVYFDVSKAGSYGELSGLNAVEMDQISRQRGGDPDDRRKKNSQDFVLWFASSEEPNWRAPWGVGRPGWHIECSAMIQQVLGDQIDIHGGGADLIYPHHESEIAQSEAYTHKVPYVQYWMHIAMVRYEGEKMSKSLGNLVLVEDLLKNYEANALRLLLLSNHYRTSWEYTETLMKKSAERWSLIHVRCHEADAGDLSDIIRALEDDLHTDRAVELLQTMSGASLRNALTLMGFLIEDAS